MKPLLEVLIVTSPLWLFIAIDIAIQMVKRRKISKNETKQPENSRKCGCKSNKCK